MTTGNKNICNFEKRGLTARYSLTPSPAMCGHFRTHALNDITRVNGAALQLECGKNCRVLQRQKSHVAVAMKTTSPHKEIF